MCCRDARWVKLNFQVRIFKKNFYRLIDGRLRLSQVVNHFCPNLDATLVKVYLVTKEVLGQNFQIKNVIVDVKHDGLTKMQFKNGDKISVDIVTNRPVVTESTTFLIRDENEFQKVLGLLRKNAISVRISESSLPFLTKQIG